ncbi:MAG: hypothetical protein LUF92_17370 [Clostridiales bacterium]|nr:hypothetical protein [Clostridiales bacterium]
MKRMNKWLLSLTLLLMAMLFGFAKAPEVKAAETSSVTTQVEALVISVSSKGFKPSKGNYLRIKAVVADSQSPVTVRLRIYNSKGKYVYQKSYKNVYGGFIDLKWNGKASKNNTAGLKAKKYVGKGKYKVEIYVYSGDSYGKKTKSFKVSSSAASGTKGLAAAKTVPILSGYAEVDYLAEVACKSAGIKSSMSDDEKVRRIYHWMTKNYKHVHYDERSGYKAKYNLTKLKKKIAAYKTKTDKKYAKGKLIYNYSSTAYYELTNMVYRYGVCDDHAAIFKILCNHAGVEAGVCTGYYLNRNGTKASHAWNYAIVNGKTYYYDVDVEIQNYGKGQGDYYWYKKTKAQAKKTHEFYTIS